MNTRGIFSRLRVGWSRNRVANEDIGRASQSGRVGTPKSSTGKTFFSRVVQWLKRILGFQKKAPQSDLVGSVITEIESISSRANAPRSKVTKSEGSQSSRESQYLGSWETIGNPSAPPRHPLPEWQQATTATDEIHAPQAGLSPPPPLPVDGADKKDFAIRNHKPHMNEFLVCNKTPAYDLTPERDFFNVKLESEFLKAAKEVAVEIMGEGRQSDVTRQGTVANLVFYEITNEDQYVNEYYHRSSTKMRCAIAEHNDYCNADADSDLARELKDKVTIPWNQPKQEEQVIGEIKTKFKDQYRHFLAEKLHKTNKDKASFLKKFKP